MAQPAPAPQTIPDATVNIAANGQVTINNGQGPIKVDNRKTTTILFTYEGAATECYLQLNFSRWNPTPANNGGTIVVGS